MRRDFPERSGSFPRLSSPVLQAACGLGTVVTAPDFAAAVPVHRGRFFGVPVRSRPIFTIFACMKLTFLGTGTSQGVPVIGCRCKVCTSADRRDNRLRTSAMVEACGVRMVIGGLDDVRAFNFVDYPPLVHKVDIYAAPHTLGVVRKDFDYAFAQDKYRGVPEIELHELDVTRPFRVGGLEVVPVSGHHSDRFAVTGYRIGRLAYLTDFKTIGDAEVEKLRGVEVLVVNALRFTEHYSHFNVAEALALIARVAPREAYLTHMSHDIGLHAVTEPTLPRGVHMAYDTLQLEIND